MRTFHSVSAKNTFLGALIGTHHLPSTSNTLVNTCLYLAPASVWVNTTHSSSLIHRRDLRWLPLDSYFFCSHASHLLSWWRWRAWGDEKQTLWLSGVGWGGRWGVGGEGEGGGGPIVKKKKKRKEWKKEKEQERPSGEKCAVLANKSYIHPGGPRRPIQTEVSHWAASRLC